MQMFISKDPIEFEAGDFNFYRYVGNDPVNFRDPSGLDPRLNGRGVPAAMGGDANKVNPSKPTVPIPASSDNHTTMTPAEIETSNANSGVGPFAGGCGAEGTKLATWIPDISPDACEKHDKCYATCGSDKRECDMEFFRSNPYYAIAVIFSKKSVKAFDDAQKPCDCPN